MGRWCPFLRFIYRNYNFLANVSIFGMTIQCFRSGELRPRSRPETPFCDIFISFKGNFGFSTSWVQMKEHEISKRTSHHWPSYANWFLRYRGSKITKHGRHHFFLFQASVSFKWGPVWRHSRTTKKMENNKYNITKTVGQICLKFCRLIELFNKISFSFKVHCHDN